MRLQDLKQLKLNDGLGFLVRFVLVLAGGFVILHLLPGGAKYTLRGLISLGSTSLAKGLGFSAFTLPGNIISIEGFSLSVIFECTAAVYIVIFTAAVIAYPASLRWRLYGLFTGLTLIMFLNLSRIVFLGWFGAHYPAHFNFVHQFVWEGGFLFIVIAIWVLWLYGGMAESLSSVGRRVNSPEGTEKHDRLRNRPDITINIRHRVAFMVFFIAIIFTTFNFFAETYMSVLATVSGWLMYVSGFGDGIIQSKGKGLNIMFPARNMGWDLMIASVFDSFLFIALVICFSKARSLARPAIYLAAGVAIIMAIHIGAVTATYMDLRDGVPDWGGLRIPKCFRFSWQR
jgi:exosortase/archaeosortase family protein